MKLSTIWTLPAMTLRERLNRTGEWALMETAARLPKRLRYWVVTGEMAYVSTHPPFTSTAVGAITIEDVMKHQRGGRD